MYKPTEEWAMAEVDALTKQYANGQITLRELAYSVEDIANQVLVQSLRDDAEAEYDRLEAN